MLLSQVISSLYNRARTAVALAPAISLIIALFSRVHRQLLGLMMAAVTLQPLHAAPVMEQFFDPIDGSFDASQFLSSTTGFLPIPMIITEPAIGYGLGLALAFFHDTGEDASNDDPNAPLYLPPRISALAYGQTENGTQFGGIGHFGSYKEDTLRYKGFIGRGDFNLTYYPNGIDRGLSFNLEGNMTLQQVLFRTPLTGLFAGSRFTYQSSSSNFERGTPSSTVSIGDLDSASSGLGLVVHYDTRSPYLAPDSGQLFKFEPMVYSESIGGDYNYEQLKLASYSYWPLSDEFVLGVRVEGDTHQGKGPFYALPYIDMRGIPAMRYQGDRVLVTELEARWDLTSRWSLTGFSGSGWTSSSGPGPNQGTSSAKIAGGLGFQYLIARRYTIRSGVEVAVGPEDTVVELSFGSNWK